MKKTYRKLVNVGGKPKYLTLEVEMELRNKGERAISYLDGKTVENPLEFSAMCYCKCGDFETAGQCFDTVSAWLYENSLDCPLLAALMPMWKKYHLNGLTAGSKRQEDAIAEWEKCGNKYEYTAACEELKRRHLYTDGKLLVDGEPYKYGYAWLFREIPADDLAFIRKIMDEMGLSVRHIEK